MFGTKVRTGKLIVIALFPILAIYFQIFGSFTLKSSSSWFETFFNYFGTVPVVNSNKMTFEKEKRELFNYQSFVLIIKFKQ